MHEQTLDKRLSFWSPVLTLHHQAVSKNGSTSPVGPLSSCRASTILRLGEFPDTNLRNYNAAGDELIAVQATDQLHFWNRQNQLHNPQERVRTFYNFFALP